MRILMLGVVLGVAGFFVLGGSCEKVALPNKAPRTFFSPGGEPPDTLLVDHWTFRWFGTDLDSDVRAYQYRVLIGYSCDSLPPPEDAAPWRRDVNPQADYSFHDATTTPDGPYVFQARTQDEYGALDDAPLTKCFTVFIQLPPIASIDQHPSPRTGVQEADFAFSAVKENRLGEVVPGVTFQYSYAFFRTNPNPETPVYTLFGPANTAHVTGLQANSYYAFVVKAVDQRFPDIISEPVRFEFQN